MRKVSIIAGFLLLALILYFNWNKESSSPNKEVTLPPPPPPTPESARIPQGTLIGEKLLHAYATEETTAVDDLQGVHRVCLSFRTLVKSFANLPIGCNLDLADALRGKNPYQQRFLPDKHRVFNDQGELIDRWNTPLHIHTIAAGEWEIRSAGPDQKLWTDDDLQLQANGKLSRKKNKPPQK
ncbi:MAG: hypothetical protein ACPG32_07675 [Akkermansiaceae bacterium]